MFSPFESAAAAMHFSYWTWSDNGTYLPERANSWPPHHSSSLINAVFTPALSIPEWKSNARIRTVFQSLLKGSERKWQTHVTRKNKNAWRNALWVQKHFIGFPANTTTCAYSRSPRNNLLCPYLCCWCSVIPIATPQRWQIRAGVARTPAGRRRRSGPHAAPA